jgi:hypothetical protein
VVLASMKLVLESQTSARYVHQAHTRQAPNQGR